MTLIMLLMEVILIGSILISNVDGTCYFSMDYTGIYTTQSTVDTKSQLLYREVQIMPNAIIPWGDCHKRFGNNILLSTQTGGSMCVQCFNLELRSPHIIEMHTKGLDKCYTNEEMAISECPTEEDIISQNTRELMLYKKHTLMDTKPLLPVYCPINGKFRFSYNHNDGTEESVECPNFQSNFENCPKGNSISLSFNQCSFSSFNKSFDCLGDWIGLDGKKYLALHESFSPDIETPETPIYRCAMYEENSAGEIQLSLSSDSTCTNNLISPSEGHESFVLRSTNYLTPPSIVSSSNCKFPDWSQGQWEHVKVEGNILSYIDMSTYKNYEVYCLTDAQDGLMQVYAKSQCDEELYTCLAIQERSSNVMEFQMSPDFQPRYSDDLCSSPLALSWDAWITQGRVDRFKESPCPVGGDYTGNIPDATDLCAKLSSDCNNPEIMFYTVYSCDNNTNIYEEREYRCLGQWGETGVTYTYTERRDVTGHECFAGVVIDEEDIYIIEAGTNCQRGLQILSYGMKLTKEVSCLNNNKPTLNIPPSTKPSWWNPTGPRTSSPNAPTTKNPTWTNTPKEEENGSFIMVPKTSILIISSALLLLDHWLLRYVL